MKKLCILFAMMLMPAFADGQIIIRTSGGEKALQHSRETRAMLEQQTAEIREETRAIRSELSELRAAIDKLNAGESKDEPVPSDTGEVVVVPPIEKIEEPEIEAPIVSDVDRVRAAIEKYSSKRNPSKAWVRYVGNYDREDSIRHIVNDHRWYNRSFLNNFTPQELVWIHSMTHYASNQLPRLNGNTTAPQVVKKSKKTKSAPTSGGYAVSREGNQLVWYVNGVRWYGSVISDGSSYSNGWTYRDGRMYRSNGSFNTSASVRSTKKVKRYKQQCNKYGCSWVPIFD